MIINPKVFFDFIGRILPENAEAELVFNLQEKTKKSVLDAAITQASFKVVIETKLHGDFGLIQLENHMQSFKNEDYKVLLTLDPNAININIKEILDQKVNAFNSQYNSNVIHRHMTFEELVNGVREIIDERDYEMLEVLDDYKEYCYTGGLIPNDWKRMRVQLAGTTLVINKELNLYYDNATRGFSGFYNTFFEKDTPYAPMGSRMFDLAEVLGIEKLPETADIAELLKDKKW